MPLGRALTKAGARTAGRNWRNAPTPMPWTKLWRNTDRPRVPGHGGPGPQPEYHEFPGRGPGALQLHQLRHGHLRRGPDGDAKPAAGHRRPVWATARPPSSRYRSSRSRKGSTTTPAIPTTTCSSWPCETSAKRLFPNFSFLDAPFNLQYYKDGDYDSEVAYMGCRTRVHGQRATTRSAR